MEDYSIELYNVLGKRIFVQSKGAASESNEVKSQGGYYILKLKTRKKERLKLLSKK